MRFVWKPAKQDHRLKVGDRYLNAGDEIEIEADPKIAELVEIKVKAPAQPKR